MAFKLRPYQNDGLSQIMSAIEIENYKNIILEAPTSYGKSALISAVCKEYYNKGVVILVNIEPLIDQISEHLKEMKLDHSILKSGRENEFCPNKNIQLIMSQTLYARIDSIKFNRDFFILQQDEGHREWNTDRTNAAKRFFKPSHRVAYTATPYDQNGYELVGSETIRTITIPELEDGGYVTPVKYYVPKFACELDLDDVRMSGNDYSGKALDEKMNTESYMNNVVAAMGLMKAYNKKTLVFCNSIDQCDMVTTFLLEAGYTAASLHSKKSDAHNELALEQFREPHFKGVLVSVSKLNIGFSVKDIELGVMLRPTKVRSLYIQTVGRLIRPFEGKQYAEFLDLAGVVAEHGFHYEPYNPPAYGDSKALADAKAKAEASALSGIVSREPTEVTREKVIKFVEELKQKAKQIHQMDMNELGSLYEQTTDIETIVKVAFQINKIKTGEPYKDNTINWIVENWLHYFDLEPEFKTKWTKALKSRAKNIVRDGKKLASLRYFVEFLYEKKDEQWYGVDIR